MIPYSPLRAGYSPLRAATGTRAARSFRLSAGRHTFRCRWQSSIAGAHLDSTRQGLPLNRPLRRTGDFYIDAAAFLEDLRALKDSLIDEHSALFVEKVDVFISIVESFGFHFTRLDIRQDSSVHRSVAEEYALNSAKDFETLFSSKIRSMRSAK